MLANICHILGIVYYTVALVLAVIEYRKNKQV